MFGVIDKKVQEAKKETKLIRFFQRWDIFSISSELISDEHESRTMFS
jgi:hypothetical protein